ncbi:DPH6, diphthine-ammonia ligase [Monocercomonoides exilis]|uniref:DPH6, diphthine-ammonia ligase n=1 Tax=Monocercomonoides exilis TaxID=2049356 RepID=UPI00355AA0EB|nr:DPH6, diphthine-ammonia ligase [Monocercomonoides exilis]|eukprot:MONOS_10648.1-p1 / transcript=MONOS_10648.1 / gene=MONOS_10648 / organism=Monocercomonoides_exilis_PA203 / gene_product=DPH6, diphthine-ammonia ligase / transcript_product=DPH6, diphthine-ammonia ligase / location=Mono_scaffold00492:22116-25772(+) / protein_length=1074 / sequence_SO=supercontig / SO=protein_coding / is_pseudo=false
MINQLCGLVSGGKDSIYNLLQCKKAGLSLVAIASLSPPDGVEELDSYMFQSVGTLGVVSQEKCIGVQFFRKIITGKSKSLNMEYTETSGDEVEDMFLLLSSVKDKFPQLQYVSTGAIASDYQRERVENVCSRLGLQNVSLLWHIPQPILLNSMLEDGVNAILVKVAAAGLPPRKILGKRLDEVFTLLMNAHKQYGVNVCGEGGEYETLVCDCPALFRYGSLHWNAYLIRSSSPISDNCVTKKDSDKVEKNDLKEFCAWRVIDGDDRLFDPPGYLVFSAPPPIDERNQSSEHETFPSLPSSSSHSLRIVTPVPVPSHKDLALLAKFFTPLPPIHEEGSTRNSLEASHSSCASYFATFTHILSSDAINEKMSSSSSSSDQVSSEQFLSNCITSLLHQLALSIKQRIHPHSLETDSELAPAHISSILRENVISLRIHINPSEFGTIDSITALIRSALSDILFSSQPERTTVPQSFPVSNISFGGKSNFCCESALCTLHAICRLHSADQISSSSTAPVNHFPSHQCVRVLSLQPLFPSLNGWPVSHIREADALTFCSDAVPFNCLGNSSTDQLNNKHKPKEEGIPLSPTEEATAGEAETETEVGKEKRDTSKQKQSTSEVELSFASSSLSLPLAIFRSLYSFANECNSSSVDFISNLLQLTVCIAVEEQQQLSSQAKNAEEIEFDRSFVEYQKTCSRCTEAFDPIDFVRFALIALFNERFQKKKKEREIYEHPELFYFKLKKKKGSVVWTIRQKEKEEREKEGLEIEEDEEEDDSNEEEEEEEEEDDYLFNEDIMELLKLTSAQVKLLESLPPTLVQIIHINHPSSSSSSSVDCSSTQLSSLLSNQLRFHVNIIPTLFAQSFVSSAIKQVKREMEAEEQKNDEEKEEEKEKLSTNSAKNEQNETKCMSLESILCRLPNQPETAAFRVEYKDVPLPFKLSCEYRAVAQLCAAGHVLISQRAMPHSESSSSPSSSSSEGKQTEAAATDCKSIYSELAESVFRHLGSVINQHSLNTSDVCNIEICCLSSSEFGPSFVEMLQNIQKGHFPHTEPCITWADTLNSDSQNFCSISFAASRSFE